MSDTPNLFKPIKVGHITLQNRLVMAPLTRFRSPGHVSNGLNVDYYAQRASSPGTLLISEAAFVSPAAGGYEHVPGLYTQDQIDAWKPVINAVHAKGSFLFIQLWALGRSADPTYIRKTGYDYIAPSPIPTYSTTVEYVRETSRVMGYNKRHPDSPKRLPRPTKQEPPRELTESEILQFIADYAQAAKNAVAAGADGVEIHGTNFYLPEQFLFEGSNQRTDKWGGSIENRARFMLAIVDAVVAAIGAERTALRLSPWVNFLGKDGRTPVAQWGYLISELERRGLAGKRLAYLHLIEPRGAAGAHPLAKYNAVETNDLFARLWSGVLVRAGGYTRQNALKETSEDPRLLIGLGRYFIANPDIVERWKRDLPLNEYDRSTFYTEGPEGYVDYPFYNEGAAKL
ncbi:hypothetical protein DS838_001696 [Geotrichum bryndzae]|nr:hypothetical protein DS838_001696 [Geotrichum bryndzae]